MPEPVTLLQSGHRTGPSTRSLRSTELSSLADRLTDLHEVARSLDGTPMRRHWESEVLGPELRLALAHLNEGDPALRERIVDTGAQILDEAGSAIDGDCTAIQRLEYHFVRRRMVPQLMECLKADRSGEVLSSRTVRRRRKHYGDFPFRDDAELAVPPEVYLLDSEMDIRARVDEVRWEGDTLLIEGYAYLRRVDVDRRDAGKLRLDLVRVGARRRTAVKLPVERVHRPDIAAEAREASYRYEWAGFRTRVHVSALRGRKGWTYGVWRLEATVSGDGVRRSKVVGATKPGRVRNPELRETEGVRIVTVNGRGRFSVEVDTMPASVTAAEVRDGDLVLTGEVRRQLTASKPAAVLVTRASGSTVLSRDVELSAVGRAAHVHRCAARWPSSATQQPTSRAARASGPCASTCPGHRRAFRCAPPPACRHCGTRRATPTGWTWGSVAPRTGRTTLTCVPPRPVVDHAQWDGKVLELAGRWPVDGMRDRTRHPRGGP